MTKEFKIRRESIHSLFEAQVKQIPQETAILFAEQSISYYELNEQANQLAHYLQKMGVQAETPVTICLERGIDLLIAILGILKAGGAYVPLDSSHPNARLTFILNDTSSPFLITKSTSKEKFSHYSGQFIFLDQDKEEINTYPIHNPPPLPANNGLAYIIYTSGSTGVPKGVLIEHHSVVNYGQWLAEYSNLQTKQRIDFSSNYVFDMAISNSIVPLMLGLTIVICDDKTKNNIRRYFDYLAENQINIIKITPSFLKVLANETSSNIKELSQLQTIILGGENLRTTDCASWLEAYPTHTLYNEYGPTETTVGVSMYKITPPILPQLGPNVPIGKPGSNIHFYILDGEKNPVVSGEIGELYIGGDCLGRGYLNQPELTLEKFIPDPFSKNNIARLYRTGDLCRQLADQSIEYIGRIDQQIKLHGFRIELEEIELTLAEHPAIQDVVVLVQENLLQEKQLVAYYILKKTNHATMSNQLRQYLQTRLPNHMIPTAFVQVNTFPRTANDKLDHSALPIPQFSNSQHYVAPATELERTLAEIWSETLGIKPVGIEDDFFELGGHSLSAINIIAKIEKRLAIEITLEDFYSANTIAKLVTIIKKSEKIDDLFDRYKTMSADLSTLPLTDFQFLIWISNLFEPKVKKLNLVARKRVQGPIDLNSLNQACTTLFKKHEILLYRICKFSPQQLLQHNLPFSIVENDLRTLLQEESEQSLSQSLDRLICYDAWNKKEPQLVLQVFYLQGNVTELQICMPHIIADNISLDILFADLSHFYLLHKNKTQITTEHFVTQKQFKDYSLHEKSYAHANFTRDYNFWVDYQKEVGIFPFPKDYLETNSSAPEFLFSTYTEIPEKGITNLQQFCAINRVSLTGGLCALLSKALFASCGEQHELPSKIMLNIIKSTRENPMYEDKVGCFLRLDTIKVDYTNKPSLTNLAKQIHQSIIKTMPYQRFSSMAKLACANKSNWQKKTLSYYLINAGIYLYTKLFRSLKLNYKLFSLYGRLSTFKRDNHFVIILNVLPSFLSEDIRKKENTLFGLKQKRVPLHQYDLLKIESVLEICFLRDESTGKPYLVISGNLKSELRELIANEMITIMQKNAIPELLHES